MLDRSPALQEFLDSLHDALAEDHSIPAATTSGTRIFERLRDARPALTTSGTRLPACSHLDEAVAKVAAERPVLARVGCAFAAIEPSLNWRSRAGGDTASANFAEGHANAMIVGPGGHENRDDVWVGVSLLAPHVRYPDHTHHPEEVYLVLSKGEFRQGGGDWFEPGMGGTLFNVPDIVHAMRSGDDPLFAIWCLRVEEAA